MQCPCCARVSSNKSDKHRATPARALRPGKLYVYWLKIPLRSRIAAARLQGGTLESAFFLLTPVDSKQISYDGDHPAPRLSMADGLQREGHLRFGLEVVGGLRDKEKRGDLLPVEGYTVKLLQTFALLAAMALLSSLAVVSATPPRADSRASASAQSQQPSQPSPQNQEPGTGQQQPPEQQQQGQTFTGTMKLNGTVYVFLDDATKATYNLDHQDQLSKYKLDGKKVQIVGTLETASNTIHVTKIAVLS